MQNFKGNLGGFDESTFTKENIENREVRQVLTENYLPYAMSVIMARAIPGIDGLKLGHRHVLYTMYLMGLLNGNKVKSSNIVGQTMKLHPHGDGAIYETMVRMTTGNGSLNMPYIESKGSMGRVESRDMAYAAHRYTEAKLAPICSEIFDGINEDAVDMVDNYDATMKEPTLFPVKFPSVLVNTAPGIAVGMSSVVPSYNLREVCAATIGVILGDIKNETELHAVLGAPDFSTGGTIHGTDREFINILKSGRGSIVLSGTVELSKNKIVVTEIPYSTSIEAIIEDVEKYIKSGELKEISDIRDESDLRGTRICMDIKRGNDVSGVLKKVYKYTRLRTSMGVNNNILIDNKPMSIGVLDTIRQWIKFRVKTVNRIYSYRYKRDLEKENLLSAWEKISERTKDALEIITKNNESSAKELLMAGFDMNEKQAEYLLDMKAKEFTLDRVSKKLSDLSKLREEIKEYKNIIENDSEKYKVIVNELKDIMLKYGKDRRTQVSSTPIDDKIEKVVDDRPVYVYCTKQGYIKRMENIRNKGYGVINDEVVYADDEVTGRFFTQNNDYILVFMYDGTVHKIPVINIESGKGNPKDTIANLTGDTGKVIYVTSAEGFKGHLNILYGTGKGCNISFSRFAGKRSKYISCYDAGDSTNMWATEEDKMFLITYNKKAAYCEVVPTLTTAGRSVFKVAKVPADDKVFGMQEASNVPDFENIPVDIYSKGYFVKIKHQLW